MIVIDEKDLENTCSQIIAEAEVVEKAPGFIGGEIHQISRGDVRRIGVPILSVKYSKHFGRGQRSSVVLQKALLDYFSNNLGYLVLPEGILRKRQS